MPKKETFTSRFEETRGGRVPQKSKIWGDVFYGWSLSKKDIKVIHETVIQSAEHVLGHGRPDIQREFFFQKFETFRLGQTNWAEIL